MRPVPTPSTSALRIALAYAALSGLWILLSDRAVEAIFRDPAAWTTASIVKGWFFVAVTAVLLWLLVRRALSRERAAQERECLAFAANRDPVFVHQIGVGGRPGRFVAVNDEASQLIGLPRERLLAMTPADIDSMFEDSRQRDRYRQLQVDGRMVMESELEAADGRRIPVEIAARCASVGGETLVIATVRDLTRRKAEQARLVDAERMSAVGLLAGGLAHEFNNLHMAVDAHLELIEMTSTDERARTSAATAHRALERATGLTRTMLDFARPGGGDRRPVHLDAVVGETLALVRRQLEADGIHIEASIPVVPAVPMDRHQIGQVVMNLLINAGHALADRPERVIRIAVLAEPDRVRVQVEDTGCGIAPQHLPRMFLPFFTTKGPGDDGRPRGTGLGLSVSRSLVEGHGGRITVESTLGVGTTVAFWLPVK